MERRKRERTTPIDDSAEMNESEREKEREKRESRCRGRRIPTTNSNVVCTRMKESRAQVQY
jgi:hypothetical protein